MPERGEITRLLDAANDGDEHALGDVISLLYQQLRAMAHRQLAGEAPGHTLDTSALVHEAYLRLADIDRIRWQDRQHLMAMAARTMRRVLIDHALRRRASKRGGGAAPVALAEELAAVDERADELCALDEALERLARLNPRQSQIVECRFFAGLSIEETAIALALSPATVKRDWTAARAWLNRELQS